MQESTGLLVGDVLLSAACIAYYGAFPGNYRQQLVSRWVDKCREYGIPVSPDCTLRGTLASPIQVHSTYCMRLHVCLYKFLLCQLVSLSTVSVVHVSQAKPSPQGSQSCIMYMLKCCMSLPVHNA